MWTIIFFCITTTSPDCMKLDNKVWGMPSGPFRYSDEESCVDIAERLAESWWNEKKFEVEYDCREAKIKWEPYVPKRRQ